MTDCDPDHLIEELFRVSEAKTRNKTFNKVVSGTLHCGKYSFLKMGFKIIYSGISVSSEAKPWTISLSLFSIAAPTQCLC